jgi:hypothetical protein
MDKQELINKYLGFKEACINARIESKDEIIKLFEVWLHL